MRCPMASQAVPAALPPDLPPRLGEDRVRVDRHDQEIDADGACTAQRARKVLSLERSHRHEESM